jgi:hypothetical protein
MTSPTMVDVHRALLMALTWAAGTAAGVVLGWQGVQLVTFQVVESAAAPLSQPHVLEALEAAGGSPGPAAAPTATSEVPALQAAPTPTPVPPEVLPRSGGSLPASLAPGAGSRQPAVSVTHPAPVTTTTTTVVLPAPAATPPPAPPTSTTTTTAPKPKERPEPRPPAADQQSRPDDDAAAEPVYRTISSKGGTVAVRYDAGGHVELLWARPNDGFRADVQEDGEDKVVVVFRSRHHVSAIKAFWADGSPRSRVAEYPIRETDDS